MKRLSIFLLSLFLFINVSGQSIEKDKEMGAEANKQLIAQIGLFNHSSKNYLNEIGQDLVSHLDQIKFDYQFGILDMAVPNALALPGGYVYFSRGILALANSEDELAGVMGHEIIHVHMQHSRKAMNKGIFTAILKIPGVLLSTVAPNAGYLLIAPFELINSSYSRSNEKESDIHGAALSAATGYDPNGLPIILHKISESVELETGKEEQTTWFDTHPYTPKRVEDLDKKIAKMNYVKSDEIASDHKAFLDKLEGLCIGDNPAVGVFQDDKFIHPEMKFTFSTPKGWNALNSPLYVEFSSPDKKAQLALAIADTALDPSVYSKAFILSYNEKYDNAPTRNERLDFGGNPAQIISIVQYSKNVKYTLSLLWLTLENRTYQFMELSEGNSVNIVEATARSLHSITTEERNSLHQTLLHIVQAQEGESVEQLSERTGNVLSLDYTLLINNLSSNEKLSSSTWVKIGVKKKY